MPLTGSKATFAQFLYPVLENEKEYQTAGWRANLAKCKVLNPLWLLAAPKKLPEADILNLIDECWGEKPVHPSAATYEKMTTSIISMEWLTPELPVARPPGLGLLADIPEWQKPQALLRFKRNDAYYRVSASKFQKRI
jgi:hypothetical protein